MNAVVAEPQTPPPQPLALVPERQLTDSEIAYRLTVQQARGLARSTIVPQTYRGEENLGNVMIALEIAHRIGASPLAVMQSLYIVSGKPSWSASFLIATVNTCGRFTPLRFEILGGDDPHADTYRVRASAKDKATGEVCVGAWITWKLVKLEGWDKKSDSKWKSIPEQMFLYRAAAFWTRIYAPELSLGIPTSDEVHDVEARLVGPSADRADLSELQAVLRARAASEPAADVDPETEADPDADPVEDPVVVESLLRAAKNRDELDAAADRIRLLADSAERTRLSQLYDVELDRISLQ